MAQRVLRSSKRPEHLVGGKCIFTASLGTGEQTKRWMSSRDAGQEWQNQAIEVRAGIRTSMFKKLEERGYVKDVTGTRQDVDRMMTDSRVGAYVGIDPTASSLHIGHMLPLMALFWMHVNGYRTVTLVGGATAKIGDPSDRLTTREKQHSSIRSRNMISMHNQLKKLWLNVDIYGRKYGYIRQLAWKRALLNNSTWWNKITLIEVLQVLGPGMRLGSMLARDTVRNKMENGDGMSFAEFTYPLLQGWDWWQMYKDNEIQMQIGGSDQYGNITAGIDAIKYISANHPDTMTRDTVSNRGTPFGFTVPLLTTSSGQKFGKSAGNAIWLDKDETSSFDLYKFFLGTSDADVGRYLKLFTFMPNEQIDLLLEEHLRAPSVRIAQHKLAREFVELVHGVEEAQFAESQHRLIFSRKTTPTSNFATPTAEILLGTQMAAEGGVMSNVMSPQGRPAAQLKLPISVIEGRSIGRILLACGLVSSSSEGHRLAKQDAIYVGSISSGEIKSKGGFASDDWTLSFRNVRTWSDQDSRDCIVFENLLIFRRGKQQIKVIEVVSDDEYTNLGLSYPGMRELEYPEREDLNSESGSSSVEFKESVR